MIPRVRGLLLAGASVVAISPDALLLVIMSSHAAPPTVLFYKSLVVSVLSLVSAAYAAYTDRSLLSSLSALPARHVLGMWVLQAASVSGFTLSVLLTTPARAMLFIALNPVWASLISVTLLGEKLPRRTLGAIVLSLSSVFLMCTDDGELPPPPALPSRAPTSGSSAVGDAVALATGCSFALYLTALRLTAQRHSRVDLSALSTGGFVVAGLGVLASTPLHGAPTLPPPAGLPPSFWLAAAADGALVVFFYALVLRASRDLTAAEMALVQLLEYAAGPIVVYAAGRSAAPSLETLVGGALLLCGLAMHETLAVLAEGGFAPAVWFDQSCVTIPILPTGEQGGATAGAGMRATLAGSWHELRSLVLPARPPDDDRGPLLPPRNLPRNRRPSGPNVVDGGGLERPPRALEHAPSTLSAPQALFGL